MSRREVLTKPRRPSNRPRVPERDVLRACLDLLAVKRIWHRRMNTGAVKAEGRFFRFGSAGMADVLALPSVGIKEYLAEPWPSGGWTTRHGGPFHPLPLWLECKSPGQKQSPQQQLFQSEVEAEGHCYLVVSDVGQLVAWLEGRGL